MSNRFTFSFTIRDFALLITAIAILLSLCVPMLVARHESARRNQCQNNLRVLTLACVNYESMYGSYPPAVPNLCGAHWISTGKENGLRNAGPNWASNVAEQMGLQTVEIELRKCLGRPDDVQLNAADDCEHVGAGVGSFRPMGTPSFMVCPAAAQPKLPHTSLHTQLENLAKGNYAACMGSGLMGRAGIRRGLTLPKDMQTIRVHGCHEQPGPWRVSDVPPPERKCRFVHSVLPSISEPP